MDVILWWGCRGGRAHANGVKKEVAWSRWRQQAGFGAASRSCEGFCYLHNWFSSIFVMFPTQENEHDWYILYSIVPIRNKEKLKIMEAQSQLSQTVHFYLFSKNKCLFFYFYMAIVIGQVNKHQHCFKWGDGVGRQVWFWTKLDDCKKINQQASVLLCCCVPQVNQAFKNGKQKINGWLLSLVRLNMDFAIINKILHETLLGGIPQQATRLKKIDRVFLPKVSTDMFFCLLQGNKANK